MTVTDPIGRRERKKAATRRAIADAALRLFLERGYRDVGVREIADAADVSTTTLFKHFPSKEALVFDDDAGREEQLVAAVAGAQGDVAAALRRHALVARSVTAAADLSAFQRLVDETPELREYARRMLLRHEDALAAAIAGREGLPPGDLHAAALARFALEAISTAGRSADPAAAVDAAFDVLERGWAWRS